MTNIEYGYNRFCKERFSLPTESQVRWLEQRIKVAFPPDYEDFLLHYNGGFFTDPQIRAAGDECPQDALAFLSGIGASHPVAELGTQRTIELFDDNDPPQILPIGGTAMGGLIILLVDQEEGRGAIFLKKAFGDFYFLADGIDDFFHLLHTPPE